jgi:hypothetical protein
VNKDFLVFGKVGKSVLWQSAHKMGAIAHLDMLATKESPSIPKIICWAGTLYWFDCDPGESPQRLADDQAERALMHVRDGYYVKVGEYGSVQQE